MISGGRVDDGGFLRHLIFDPQTPPCDVKVFDLLNVLINTNAILSLMNFNNITMKRILPQLCVMYRVRLEG